MVSAELEPKKGRNHAFVCEVVSKTENKLGCVARPITVGENEPLCDLSFVDEPWTNFEVCLASHDFHIELLANRLLKCPLTLPCLECTILWVCPAIMPRQGNLLSLNE